MSASNVRTLQRNVKDEIQNIDYWIRANKLSFNCNKTSYIILNRPKGDTAIFNISINSQQICEKNDIRYLSIILDNKLSWKPHIAKLTTQIFKSCGILSILRHYTTPPVLKAVYNALIHPYLNYAVLNWARASKTTIQPLENLQNKAVKFLKTSNKATLGEIYIKDNILTINNLFKMSAGKFMHSYENNQLPSHFNQYLDRKSVV